MAASCSPSPGRYPAHPGWFEASAPIAACLSSEVCWVLRGIARLLSGCAGARTGRQFAGLEVAPQRDQQLAGERHDHDLADASFGAAGARGEPEAERALRLEAQPAPSQLHQDAAYPRIAVLADPLLALGDFNAGETNPAFRQLLEAPEVALFDTFRSLYSAAREVGTFNGFEGTTSGEKIDAVLAKVDRKASRPAEKLEQALAANSNGKWVDDFWEFRREFALAPRAEPVLAAYAEHPERFPNGPPKRPVLAPATYINPPHVSAQENPAPGASPAEPTSPYRLLLVPDPTGYQSTGDLH